MSDVDKVIVKIQKLLAMAEDTSSPNEAMLAASRARKLMDKYQLSKADIEKEIGSQFLETQADKKTKRLKTWIQYICAASALLNDCEFVLSWDGIRAYKFRGFKPDAIVAKLTADYLISACEKACSESEAFGVSEKNFFRVGFAEQVLCRATDIAEDRKREFVNTGTGTALVPLKMSMIQAHFGVLKKARQPQVRKPSHYEEQAYLEGSDAGRSINLDKQLEGDESVKLTAPAC